MSKFNFNKESGQASRTLLVLAVVVLVAAVITYLIIKMAEKPPKPPAPETPTVQLPVYDTTINNIKFVFESAQDYGNALRRTQIINKEFGYANQQDLSVSNIGAKFVVLSIGAQNMGKTNTEQGVWVVENIVDSEGREFNPVESYLVNPWLPQQNLCSSVLKPAFEPTLCMKIYEISKQSTGLKVRVSVIKDKTSNKKDTSYLDLIVK